MNKLIVTAVIETLTPPQWAVQILENVDLHHSMQLNRIIVQNETTDQTPTSQQTAVRKPNNTQLHRIARKLLYGYIDRPRFDLKHRKAQSLPTKLSALVDEGSSSADNNVQHVVLHLGNINSKTLLPEAEHGIWFINHDALEEQVEKAMLFRQPLLWVHLWSSKTSDINSAKRISSHSLPMQSYSISDALSYGFGTLPDFILSRLNWLANGCDPTQYEADQIDSTLLASYDFPTKPNNASVSGWNMFWRTLKLLALQTQQRVRDKTQFEQWQLAFTKHISHPTDAAVDDYTALTPPGKTIWADPHLIVENDKTHVFFEALDFHESKGRIDWAVLTEDGFENDPKPVLVADHHLSYPFLFKHDNDIYMIPETAANRAISLYKASNFPLQWELDRHIMENIDAADSTVFQHDGLWWMFTNGVSHRSVDERDQLMLFYTDDVLNGEWHPHPLNPVVTGIDRARNAGGIYQQDGKLFRPSQYGAKRYGYGVNTSVIHTLTKTDYKETLMGRVTPNSNDPWIGCHTFVRSDTLTVVDRLTRIKRAG